MARREPVNTHKMAAAVRFTEVVKAAGEPEVYLPLADPKEDRNFMRAVGEQRVLSLKQQPTGSKKDFGSVGFLEEKYVTYLIFPKALTAFAGKRVVGINYETVQQADVTTSKAAPASMKRDSKPAAPKPKPKLRPKKFTATVRVTTTNEVKVTLTAFDETEARSKAERQAQKKVRSPARAVEAEMLTLAQK